MAYRCPACGYDGLERPPRSPGGSASFEICPSCGFEFGVTDGDEGFSYDTWRQQWVANGSPWWSTSTKPPKGWDPQVQLQSLDEPR